MKSIFGAVVTETGLAPGLIEYDNGVIVNFKRTSTPNADSVKYPSPECVIFPGFIDIHTHCREDVSRKEIHKEDYQTAGLAALNGGVTFIADMPNNHIAPVSEETYKAKKAIADKCPVDVLLYAGIGPDTRPFSDNIPYKAFMGPSIGELYFSNNASLADTMSYYRKQAVSFHCEDPVLLELHKDNPTHERRRPAVCEVEAIEFAIIMISKYALKGKVCHVSTMSGMHLINLARNNGSNISVEITPHHLYFDHSMITPERDRFLQMNPPLRTRYDRDRLLVELKSNLIDYLASDHAPHTLSEKIKGISGVPELDTYGPFVAWLLKQSVNPSVIYNMACKKPGEWVGSFTGRKVGQIAKGYEATFSVLNLSKTAADVRHLYTKCAWSPFDLRLLPGMVQDVYLKGELVVSGDYIVGDRGIGI